MQVHCIAVPLNTSLFAVYIELIPILPSRTILELHPRYIRGRSIQGEFLIIDESQASRRGLDYSDPLLSNPDTKLVKYISFHSNLSFHTRLT